MHDVMQETVMRMNSQVAAAERREREREAMTPREVELEADVAAALYQLKRITGELMVLERQLEQMTPRRR